jgi:hypothetical protein
MHGVHFPLAPANIDHNASACISWYLHVNDAGTSNRLIDIKVSDALELVRYLKQLGYYPNRNSACGNAKNKRNRHGGMVFSVQGETHETKHHEKRGKPMNADYLEPIPGMMRVSVRRAIAYINVNAAVHVPTGKSKDLAYQAQQHTQRTNDGANQEKMIRTGKCFKPGQHSGSNIELYNLRSHQWE